MKGLLVTYLLVAVGTVGGVFVPVWGAMAYWALSILRPEELWFWAVSPGRYVYYVAICTLLGWAITRRFGNWDNLRAVSRPLKFLLGYLAFSWLSAMVCDTPGSSSEAAMVYTKDILIVLVTVLLVDSFAALRRLTWVVVVSVGYLALDLNVSYYTGWNRLLNVGFGGVDNNGMAMVFAMTVPLSVGLGAYEKDWRLKAAALVWVPFQVNAVFFAFSRCSMLGLGAAAVGLFWLLPKSRFKPVLMALLVIGAMALAGSEVQKRFGTIFRDRDQLDGSAASRYETWGAAWACIKEHPVLGVGPRGFNRISSTYGLEEGKSVHNLLLQVSADIGLPGSACLLGTYLSIILLMIRRRRQRQSEYPWFGHWVAMIVAGLVAFLVASQFIGMEQVSMPYFLTGLGMMAMRLAAKSPEPSRERSLELRAVQS